VFIVRSVCPHISVLDIYKGALPYLILLCLTVLAVTIWPDITLFLVKQMFSMSY
jgi:TRAP-type mannitol/chloroaromatic compound transport system permease large subunit